MNTTSALSSQKVFNNLDPNSGGYDEKLHAFTSRITAIDDYKNSFGKIGGVMPITGSDVFTSSRAIATSLVIATPANSPIEPLNVNGPQKQLDALQEGDIVMVTDCNKTDIFSISSANGLSSGNIPHSKSVPNGLNNNNESLASATLYPPSSQVLLMSTATYFIGESDLLNEVNSLYRYSTFDGSKAIELVPNIEDMQLLYSIDSDGDNIPDTYLEAGDLTNEEMDENVYGVNVELIIKGSKNMSAPQLDNYPDDGYMRKRYTNLIQLRNAGLSK
jgi:type IV pilus assembly protein PilW